ncbi:unnamed protein product [Rangifer tarandus platyrhynchus]|uniref:Uncharacterized protein n=2 Tax=Rangifer tarandus platyrhynchus TaxID=3082113 RepID=A0AC59ZMZ4_RANTA|nr:unnamed protein product [Rangifer tarandus platyrhynchus]
MEKGPNWESDHVDTISSTTNQMSNKKERDQKAYFLHCKGSFLTWYFNFSFPLLLTPWLRDELNPSLARLLDDQPGEHQASCHHSPPQEKTLDSHLCLKVLSKRDHKELF